MPKTVFKILYKNSNFQFTSYKIENCSGFSIKSVYTHVNLKMYNIDEFDF